MTRVITIQMIGAVREMREEPQVEDAKTHALEGDFTETRKEQLEQIARCGNIIVKVIPIKDATSKILTGELVDAYPAGGSRQSRWTTRGFEQQVNGRENFVAAAPSLPHLKAMLANAELRDHAVAFGDGSGAFYQAPLTEGRIFLEPPPEAGAPEGHVWEALCACPGLEGAPKAWGDHGANAMEELAMVNGATATGHAGGNGRGGYAFSGKTSLIDDILKELGLEAAKPSVLPETKNEVHVKSDEVKLDMKGLRRLKKMARCLAGARDYKVQLVPDKGGTAEWMEKTVPLVISDSSSALHIAKERGPGKVDHVGVRFLELQQWSVAVWDMVRQQMFQFLTKICNRKLYSKQGVELLSMLLTLPEWTDGDVVDEAAVMRVLDVQVSAGREGSQASSKDGFKELPGDAKLNETKLGEAQSSEHPGSPEGSEEYLRMGRDWSAVVESCSNVLSDISSPSHLQRDEKNESMSNFLDVSFPDSEGEAEVFVTLEAASPNEGDVLAAPAAINADRRKTWRRNRDRKRQLKWADSSTTSPRPAVARLAIDSWSGRKEGAVTAFADLAHASVVDSFAAILQTSPQKTVVCLTVDPGAAIVGAAAGQESVGEPGACERAISEIASVTGPPKDAGDSSSSKALAAADSSAARAPAGAGESLDWPAPPPPPFVTDGRGEAAADSDPDATSAREGPGGAALAGGPEDVDAPSTQGARRPFPSQLAHPMALANAPAQVATQKGAIHVIDRNDPQAAENLQASISYQWHRRGSRQPGTAPSSRGIAGQLPRPRPLLSQTLQHSLHAEGPWTRRRQRPRRPGRVEARGSRLGSRRRGAGRACRGATERLSGGGRDFFSGEGQSWQRSGLR
ncbi:unnamed protein product [Prorocentrum cordatum]|uniref:Uncharacterized protein n=1 Tax=Prorocentrum cordatum TaxID=2364126 RepID=A0ABN9QPN6_9DINO|nr:unnamed protein product [Polarella glacialis]